MKMALSVIHSSIRRWTTFSQTMDLGGGRVGRKTRVTRNRFPDSVREEPKRVQAADFIMRPHVTPPIQVLHRVLHPEDGNGCKTDEKSQPTPSTSVATRGRGKAYTERCSSTVFDIITCSPPQAVPSVINIIHRSLSRDTSQPPSGSRAHWQATQLLCLSPLPAARARLGG